MAEQTPAELRILGAALYAPRSIDARVSRQWIEAVVPYLSGKVPVQECSYYGPSEVHLGRGRFQDLQPQLLADVLRGSVVSVELNAHHLEDEGLSLSWQACATIDLVKGYAFVGAPHAPDDQAAEILRHLYSASKSITQWRYGITYTHSSWRAPALYAIGMGGGSGPVDSVRRIEDTDEFQDRLSAWWREYTGKRRHLRGLFRDVYPANLLSEEHVQAQLRDTKSLLQSGLGIFEHLDPGIWLWQVPSEQIPVARAALVEAGLLIGGSG